ncbi:MAG: fused MFS/spermidine synthase [Flavobacteriales bacterium]
MLQNKTSLFYLICFVEGGCVMAAELLGAKMLAPYFGSSLYVWATVMAITLGGLAGGYFAGGLLSTSPKRERTLYLILILAALFTVFMPITAKLVFFLFGKVSLLISIVLSAILLLFPSVFFMGMVSPLLIGIITDDVQKAGQYSGRIYALSTVGGILATFLFGFYIIPTFGLTLPAVFTGVALAVIPAFRLFKSKGSTVSIILLLITGWGVASQVSPDKTTMDSPIRKVYSSEGLLGQMVILDYPTYIYFADTTKPKDEYSRWLFVNRISQTYQYENANEEKGEEKYFTYVYRIKQYVDELKKNKPKTRVLLLGLGAGSVVKMLQADDVEIDVCELDLRMPVVAEKYFGLKGNHRVFIDDARHFININENTYDIIIFDTFKGEVTPSHVFTLESLSKIKNMLADGGMVFVNGFGYWEGKRGMGMRSIYKTFEEVGFTAAIHPTAENEEQRNLLFIASVSAEVPEWVDFLPISSADIAQAEVLSDEYPRFELMNLRASLSWRNSAINMYRSDFYQQAIPLFE